jgi:tetratricopeptide (TPR) repeat protein
MLLVTWAAAAVAEPALRITPATPDTIVLRLEPRLTRASHALTPLEQADRLQYRHRYAEAEAILDEWLAARPADVTARLQRAQLRVARGNPRGALADCVTAAPQLSALAGSACQAQAIAALGDLRRARALIEAALQRSTDNVAVESWARGIAAELAMRTGDNATAERWYRAALAGSGGAHFPRVAYAEFLLSQGRAAQVLALLENAPEDATVLRLRRRAIEQQP